MTRDRRSPERWFASCLLLALATLAACGGTAGDEEFDTQPTATVPVRLDGDGLEWSPAHEPGAAEAALVAALAELGKAMLLPTAPPPSGEPATATFNARAEGYPSGATFAGTTAVSLVVASNDQTLAVVSTPPAYVACPNGSVTRSVRGDPDACVLTGSFHEVWWDEGGWSFHANLAGGVSLEDGLAWLETWRLVP